MPLKRFQQADVVHTTVKAHPDVNFIIHSGTTYHQKEKLVQGNFSNSVKHINTGHVSAYELNVNRPSGSLISSFIEKSSTRYGFRTVTANEFDDENMFLYGDRLTQAYPLSASISRIYVPAGPEYSSSTVVPHGNKKYVRALKNVISSGDRLGISNKYDDLGTRAANLICVPGVFYGSKIDPGSLELNYYLTGTLVATAKDLYSDGRLIQTYPTTGSEVGVAIYNQGILILTGSESLHDTHQDKFLSTLSVTSPTWLTFGTGMNQISNPITTGTVVSSSYSIDFKGTNSVPTLTMFAYAEKGEFNFSQNPTYLSSSTLNSSSYSGSHYAESRAKIKKINKSDYADHEEDFVNTTYISKVGIYDKNKNLIAVATLANPIKKTESRDYMVKMTIDF